MLLTQLLIFLRLKEIIENNTGIIILEIITIITIFKMRSYELPAPRGKYNVGYQYINIPDKKLEFAVYYPT